MWFGTDGGGAIAFRNGVFRNYTTSDGLPANVVFQVYEDSKGILWLATVNGLVRCDDERRSIFSTIDHRQGLPSTVIFDIVEDNNGVFWLTTPDGAIAIKRDELMRCADGTQQRILYSQYTKADGMSATECTGASKGFSTGGMIWLPTLNGVSVVNNRKIWSSTIAPAVYVERLIADGRIYTVYDSLWQRQTLHDKHDFTDSANVFLLSAGTRTLEIDYTGLSMTTPAKTSFRYMLEGFDSSWVDAGTRRKAFYTNLPPRLYRFRVLACNNDGVWSPYGDTLIMRVEPFFFQTWWFLLCCVLCGCGVLYLGYRYRIRALRRQQRALLTIVDERTSHIRSQNEEILRQQAVLEEQSRDIEIANGEIQERNAQLHATNLHLKELDETKNEVIRIVAHDLKNPLSGIILASSTVERYAERMSPSELAAQARKIRLVGARMSAIITDLLDTDALDSGKMSLTMEVRPLAPLVRAAVDEMRSQAEQKSIELVYDDGDNHHYAVLDERIFRQVIDNLISNAIKYSPSNTQTIVRVTVEGQNVRVEVQDEGPGISQEDMQKLFGKFARLSARPTGGENSTGLGLSIVKRLVEAMNGKVWCESEMGKGSTFIVELPAV